MKWVVISLALTGCAAQPPFWEDLPNCAPCEEYTLIGLDTLPYRSTGLNAWITREGNGKCTILYRKGVLDRVIQHEMQHGRCKHHPNYIGEVSS